MQHAMAERKLLAVKPDRLGLGSRAAGVPRAPRRPAHAERRGDATLDSPFGRAASASGARAPRLSLTTATSNTGTRKREPELEGPSRGLRNGNKSSVNVNTTRGRDKCTTGGAGVDGGTDERTRSAAQWRAHNEECAR